MVKKPRKQLDLSALKSIGSGLRDITVAAATHPTIAALAIMAGCSVVKMATGAYKEKEEWQRRLSGELTGLYNGAQALGMTAAVVPLAITGVQAVTSVAGMYAGKKG